MTHWDEKTMRKIAFLITGCLSFFLVTCAQQVPNPANCVNDPAICALQGPTWLCDEVRGQCTNGTCSTDSDCVQPGAAACGASKLCGPCSSDEQCAAWSVSRAMDAPLNFCVMSSGINTCVACRASTDCSDPANPVCDARSHLCSPCGRDNDCRDALNPVCDTASHLCRPCQQNSECTTGICRKAGDYPETPPVGMQNGQCAQPSQTAVVNNSGAPACADSNPGTAGSPLCTIGKAVALNKSYITVVASMNAYAGFTVNGGSFVISGPGRNLMPTATIAQMTVNNGSVAISGVALNHAAGDASTVVTCNGSGSSVYVVDSGVGPSGGRGIDSSNDCNKLYVERTAIFGNNRIGLLVGGFGSFTTKFRVVNNAMTFNGFAGGNESDAVAIGMATGYFAFNTVAGNGAGIGCLNPTTISDSIAVNNPTFNVLGCTATRVVTTEPDFLDKNTGDVRLMNTAKNRACCIDQGMATPGQSVPTDYYGLKRPQGGGYDIGFSELY